MADFSALKTAIQNAIRTNGNNEITGLLLQDILLSMVVVLGDEAITNVADDLSTETTQRRNADGTLQGNINAEATARGEADRILQNAINTINSNFSNGYVYAGIATPSATPVTGKVFYIATTAGTYTNFGGLTVTKGINILKYNGSSWSQEKIIGIDDYPTAGSSGLALSGGVDAEIKSLVGYYTCGTAAATAAKTINASAYILLQGGSIKVKFTYKNTAADATLKIGSADAKPLFYGGRRAGSSNSWEAGEVVEIFYDGTNYMANNVMGGGAGDGAFDISVYNAVDGTPTPYTDLAAALGTNGANIPDTLRKGGMSVKFIQGTVQSSDNKYVQYRLTTDSWSADVPNWQEEDWIDILNQFEDVEQVNLSLYANSAYIDGTKWMVNTSYRGKFIPVKGGELIKFVAKSDRCAFAFLPSDQYVSGQTVVYAEGCSKYSVANGAIEVEKVPADAKFVWVQTRYESNYMNFDLFRINKTVCQDASEYAYNSKYGTFVPADYTIHTYAINDTGKYGTSNSYSHKAVQVIPGETYCLKSTGLARYCFAKTHNVVSGGYIDLVDGTSVFTTAKGGFETYINIPEGCNWLLVFKASTVYKFITSQDVINIAREIERTSVSYNQQLSKTELEKNIARSNIDSINVAGNKLGIDNNLTYYDNLLVSTDINSEGTVISGDSRVGYKQVAKGDILTVVGHSDTGENSKSNIVLWFSSSKPAIGSTGLARQLSKPIDGGITDVSMEWTAPADGWLCVRHFPRSTNYYLLYKKEDYSNNINNYIPDTVSLNFTAGKGIDANADSLTFGGEVSINNSNYGCTDYIVVDGAKYIKYLQCYSTAAFASTGVFGSVFYDSEKNPISVAFVIVSSSKWTSKYSYIVVPSNARYIRITKHIDVGKNVLFFKTLVSDLKNHVDVIDENIEIIKETEVIHDDVTGLLKPSKKVTIIPSASETYNAYYRAGNATNFRTDGVAANRLTYYPEIYVVGGSELTIRYSGNNGISVYELKAFPLGSSCIDAFATGIPGQDFLQTTWLPDNTSENFTGEVAITLQPNTRRIAFVLGSTQNVAISPSEITDNISEIEVYINVSLTDAKPVEGSSNTITSDAVYKAISDLKSYKELVAQAKFVTSNPTIQSLGLIHFSDIHGDQTAANNIVKQITELSSYITDVICTGDSVHYYADGTSDYPQGHTWWKEQSGLADKALFVLGNHDSATTDSTEYDQKEDSAAWDGKGKDWCFETYIEPYISELGYVMPNGHDDPTSPNYHACYWHKDYTAQKIRLIGLDCLHRFDGVVNSETGEITAAGVKWTTNEQEVWLIEKLNETLDSNNAAYGYSVVVCCHYPLDNFSGNNEEWDDSTHKFIYNQKSAGGRVMSYKTGDVAVFHWGNSVSYDAVLKFNMRNRIDNGYTDHSRAFPNYTQGSTNNVGEILKAWKTRGGKFVAWLCGHTHMDYMWYSTKYPDMLCIVIDQAGCLRGTGTGNRSTALDSRTCANYVAIDTQNGLIKIVRIGYTMNKLMNSHKYMCYDYINKKVLNEG